MFKRILKFLKFGSDDKDPIRPLVLKWDETIKKAKTEGRSLCLIPRAWGNKGFWGVVFFDDLTQEIANIFDLRMMLDFCKLWGIDLFIIFPMIPTDRGDLGTLVDLRDNHPNVRVRTDERFGECLEVKFSQTPPNETPDA